MKTREVTIYRLQLSDGSYTAWAKSLEDLEFFITPKTVIETRTMIEVIK